MVIYGPKGTVAMTENLTKAFSEDIRIRIDDEDTPPAGVAFAAKDIEPGLIYDLNGVKVTSYGQFENLFHDHQAQDGATLWDVHVDDLIPSRAYRRVHYGEA